MTRGPQEAARNTSVCYVNVCRLMVFLFRSICRLLKFGVCGRVVGGGDGGGGSRPTLHVQASAPPPTPPHPPPPQKKSKTKSTATGKLTLDTCVFLCGYKISDCNLFLLDRISSCVVLCSDTIAQLAMEGTVHFYFYFRSGR